MSFFIRNAQPREYLVLGLTKGSASRSRRCCRGTYLGADPQRHRGKQFRLSTLDQRIGSSRQVVSDRVGTLGHESAFFHGPEAVLGEEDTHSRCSPAHEDYVGTELA